MTNIMQGDALGIPLLVHCGGRPVTAEDVDEVRVTINDLTKVYPETISYTPPAFIFPVTQEETFGFPTGIANITVRIRFADGTVRGWASKSALQIRSSADKVVF